MVCEIDCPTLDDAELEEFVGWCRGSSFYHRPQWIGVLESVYGHVACPIRVRRDGRTTGFLPLVHVAPRLGRRRLVCLPFSHSVGPLCGEAEDTEVLVEAASRMAGELNVGELLVKGPCGVAAFNTYEVATEYLITDVELSADPEVQWSALRASARRNVRKAQREGVTVVHHNDAWAYGVFAEIMTETRRRQGVPDYPVALFPEIRCKLGDKGAVGLYLAYVGGQPVAGAVVAYGQDTAIYLYAASRGRDEVLRARPNDLLMWHVLQEAARAGMSRFDFGITHQSNAGLRHFKEGWGGVSRGATHLDVVRGQGRGVGVSRTGPLARWVSRFLRNAPLPMYRMVSNLLMRRLA